MSTLTRPTDLRKFRLWQLSLFLAAVLLIVSLVISIINLLALRPLHDTGLPVGIQTLTDVGFWAGAYGLFVGLMAIVIGIMFMARIGRPQGITWRRFGTPIAAFVVLGVASIIGFVLETAAEGPFIFNNLLITECSYHYEVTVFEDQNSNGRRDAGEPGIPQVTVSLQHSLKYIARTPEGPRNTDQSGVAQFFYSAYDCLSKDTISLSVAPPTGYTATTPLSFGPYPLRLYYPKQPPVEAISIGLHKS